MAQEVIQAGIFYDYIIQYLSNELHLPFDGTCYVYNEDLRITVVKNPDRYLLPSAKVGLPSTTVTLTGSAESLQEFAHRFQLRFLSAGG